LTKRISILNTTLSAQLQALRKNQWIRSNPIGLKAGRKRSHCAGRA
jgi:hypothetical protein